MSEARSSTGGDHSQAKLGSGPDSAESADYDALLEQFCAGRGTAETLGALFAHHRDRLWRMVRFRMDRRLAGRIDPDDVLQEAYLNAADRVPHFLKDATRSLFVWFRLIVGQTLVDVHRRHLMAEMRDVDREISLEQMRYPQAPSVSIAAELLGSITSPSQALARGEVRRQLEAAIDTMSEMDQEIIALRHFEDLTNSEVAEVLGIQPSAASNRYVRAIARLKDVLTNAGGFTDVHERGT